MPRDRTRNFILGGWAGLFVATMAITAASAHRIPFSDDWNLVPVIAGDRPVTWSWLWAQHNEHRVPLLKGVHLGLLRAFAFDYRPIALLHVVLIGAAGFWMTWSLAKDRGRWAPVDVLPAIILLNPALGTYGWSFYTQFVAAMLAVLLIAGLPSHPTRSGTTGRLGLALLLCGTSGISGLVLLPAVFVACVVLAQRAGRDDVGTAAVAAAIGVSAALSGAAYFVGYESTDHSWPRPSVGAVAWWSLRIAGLALGPQLDRFWPLTGLVVACIAMTVAWGWRRGWVSLAFPKALAMVMIGLLAASVAIGRAGRTWSGVAGHYAPLMAPLIPIAAGHLGEVRGAPRMTRASALLWPLMLAGFSATFAVGAITALSHGRELRAEERIFHDALSTSMSDEELITSHIDLLYFADTPTARDILREALPSYRDSRD